MLLNDNHELLELEPNNRSTKMQDSSPNDVTASKKFKLRRAPGCWIENNSVMTGTTNNEILSPVDAMMPLLQGDSSLVDSFSHSGSLGWERIGSGTTPGSSVDLEWENEIGLSPVPLNALETNEELNWLALTETTATSWQSSPVSNANGLEWDGDFTSVEISNITADTQNLIRNLDDRKSIALNMGNNVS